jgi:predicted DNA-binding transcriptional regulator YafY
VLPSLEALGPLQEAIRRRSVARFWYRGSHRAVEGDSLVFSRGAWYLHGVDRSTDPPGGTRTFRVDRIESDIEFGEPGEYELPSAETPPEAPIEAEPVAVATLEVDRRHASSIVELTGEASVLGRSEDGSVTLEVPVTDLESFVSFVLGLGTSAVVLGPPDVRAAVIAQLEMAVGP